MISDIPIADGHLTIFRYTNDVPPVARPGKNTNVIVLTRESDGRVSWSRRYVKADGTVDSYAITYLTESRDASAIAKSVHWGCCGWVADGHQIKPLVDIVDSFIKKGSE